MRWRAILRATGAERRAGVRGFRLFVACLAIGAAAIAGAGSTASAFRAGLAAQSRAILGGDLSFSLRQRHPTDAMLAWAAQRGATSLVLEANAMATGPRARRLAQVRAVDSAHPLEGAISLKSGASLQNALAPRNGTPSAVAEQALFTALGAKVGDRVPLAAGTVILTDVIVAEPDAIGRGFAFAPRLLMRLADVDSVGLGREGSLYETELRVALPDGVAPTPVKAALEAAFPDLKGRVRTRDNATPGLKTTIDRLESFLGFVGLAALLAGGLGVQGAVNAYVESRRPQIAALKALGASGADVRAIVGLNVATLAVFGILIGLAIGAAAPFIAVALAGDALPIPAITGLDPKALGAAALLSAIAAFAFAVGPIGLARATAPAVLFRGAGGDTRVPWQERIAGGVGLLALAGAAAALSKTPLFAGALALAAFAAFGLLRGLGLLARFLAKRLRTRARGVTSLALAGLGGRGSLAPAAAPAIGLGVALLVFLTQIQSNLVTQVSQTAPKRFATAVFLEVPPGKGPDFDALAQGVVNKAPSPDWYQRAPVLTARVTALNDRELDPEQVKESERWIVQSDISASFLNARPATFVLTEGSWWPSGYTGPPLVSLETDAGHGIGAKVGDTMRFEVLGREIDAKVANLRKVNFDEMGPNFALVFAPGTFEAANPRSVAMVRLQPDTQERLEAAIAERFPTVVILRIRDALEAAATLFRSLALAINAVAGVAIVAGALAVAGAIAAGARRRIYEAAILKTLGFTRSQVIAALALEMALVGVIAAALGVALGFAGAYPIVVSVFEARWSPDLSLAFEVAGGATLALAIVGALAGLVALSTPPARVLRADA
jgi:putative ABC transport system permease protein